MAGFELHTSVKCLPIVATGGTPLTGQVLHTVGLAFSMIFKHLKVIKDYSSLGMGLFELISCPVVYVK